MHLKKLLKDAPFRANDKDCYQDCDEESESDKANDVAS